MGFLDKLGSGLGVLGSIFGASSGSSNYSDMQEMMKYNPGGMTGAFGSGSFTDGMFNAQQSPQEQARAAMMQQMFGNQMGGGMFQNQGFQNAFQQATGGMGGDYQNAQGLMSQMMGPQAFGNLQGATNQMMGQGMSNLQKAGDSSGLINQNLAASRALAQPFEEQQRNNFFDTEFGKTMGATSGSGQRGMNFANMQSLADQQRIMNAQQLGADQQSRLGNLGMQQMQQGFAGEGQGFSQMLSALQQNQSSGQSRLQNAMGMFGMGNQMQDQGIKNALAMEGGLQGQNQFWMDMMNNLAGNESGRIGAQAGGMGALNKAEGTSASGWMSALGGLAGGIGGIFGL